MEQIITIDPAWSVNEIVARYPATVAVFNRFGIDSCCGGAVALEEAAQRDGVQLETLVEELREAVAQQ